MLSPKQFIIYSLALLFSHVASSNTNNNSNSQVARTKPMLCPIPSFAKIAPYTPIITDDRVNIYSRYASIEKDQIAEFKGGVTLVDKNQKITANELAFDRLSMQLNALGNIHYQGNNINIFADALNASKANKSTKMTNASYQLDGSPGHGSAKSLFVSTDGQLNLTNATFTTCLAKTPDWQLKASEINLSPGGDFGEAYHAQFRVFDVPILYVPYFSFPVSDKRTSGFLYPKINTSRNSGLEIEIPFYWNIAENLDATFTPHYMSKRGMQLQTEFRYLLDLQSGKLDLEYLDKDKALSDNSDPRYLARFQHIGNFSDNFRAYIDYTTISDDNYLVDIGSRQYNSNDAYLYQIGELSYFGDQWQTTLKVQDFEVLGEHQPSYKTLPHLEMAAQQPLHFLSGQFELYSEISRFHTTNKNQVQANRYHVEAGLTFPLSAPAWFLNSEIKLLHTYYQQENIQSDTNLDEKVKRTLPKIRFHGGINFDRDIRVFDHSYRHTLEPQLQYLYIPEKYQDNIGLYDTTNLQNDFNGLFRDKRYSGLDRIAGANQYTLGITTRLLESSNLEVFRFSVGRIKYLSDSASADLKNLNKTNQPNWRQSLTLEDLKSSVAADIFYRINHQWQISGNIQYNTLEDFTNKGQVNLDYQFNKYNTLQLNHRYTRNVSDNSLEQVSLLTSVAMDKDWAFVGRLTRDLQKNRYLESYLGVQYESCCWAIRLAYHHHINSNVDEEVFNSKNRREFDSGFMLHFMVKGLNGQQATIGTQEMFNDSIFGYKRPYYLNN